MNNEEKHCADCYKEHSPQFCPFRPAPEIKYGINCEHKNIQAYVDVNRIEDKKAFIAAVKIECTDCNMPFEFIGVEAGMMFDKPMCNVTAQTLLAPIKPKGSDVMPGIPGFRVKAS